MNAIAVYVFISVVLFGVFGLLPSWIYYSHTDHINHDRYLLLEEV